MLNSWGVKRCTDFGDIVFNLIEYNVFSKTDNDRREDFTDLYSFEEAFLKPFLPTKLRKDPTGPSRRSRGAGARLKPRPRLTYYRIHGIPSFSAAADLRLLDPFWREPAERTVLPNGLTLILKPDRSAALASVQVWVKTGSIHEGGNARRRPIALLGAHALQGHGPPRAGREISASVQAHGGYINAYTTFDRTVYYIDLPRRAHRRRHLTCWLTRC